MNTTNGSENVVSLLQQKAREVPEKPALIEPAGTHDFRSRSFSELWSDVGCISSGLRKNGLSRGDRMLIMIPMSIDLYRLLLGTLKAGAVPVFIDPWISYHRIIQFATFADLTGFAGIPKSHALRWIREDLRNLPITVTTGAHLAGIPANQSLSELLNASGNDRIEEVASSDTALITFTGGTSGQPKGANRTHGILRAQHRVLSDEFPPIDGADMTMFPVFALNNLANGVTTVIPDMDFTNVSGIDAGRIIQQMERHEVTSATVSPPFLQRLVEHVVDDHSIPDSLQRVVTGGAPIHDRQLKNWLPSLNDVDLRVVYGSTEAEPVAHIDAEERLRRHEEHPGRNGTCNGAIVDQLNARTIPLTDEPVSSPDVETSDSRSGEEGAPEELIVTGDHVCTSYFRNEEADRQNKITEEKTGRTWHRMGDAGFIDQERRFWFSDRTSSFIHRKGEWIGPSDVEEQVKDIRGVKDAAAVGIEHEQLGEQLVLFIVTDNPKTSATVREQVEQQDQPVDRIITRTEPLPVDSRHNSKTDYEALRNEFIEQENGTVTEQSSFLSRMYAYTNERFPLHEQGLLIVSYVSANSFLAQVLQNPGHPVGYHLSSLFGALTLLGFFFHLRVFDEHKDFEEDLKYHDDRVLQKGIVSLVELTGLGGIVIALEFVFSALVGSAALISLAIAFGYSLLMLKEFFVRDWLKEHRFLYTLSHMLIMPLLALTVWSFATKEPLWEAPMLFWIYAFVGVFVTLNWEISRKIKAPEEEREGVFSYTKLFGTYGAAYLVLLMRVIDTAMVSWVGYHLGVSWWFYGIVIALFLVCLIGFFRYRFDTSPSTASQMELYAGFYIVAFDLTLAGELLRMNGFEIGGTQLI